MKRPKRFDVDLVCVGFIRTGQKTTKIRVLFSFHFTKRIEAMAFDRCNKKNSHAECDSMTNSDALGLASLIPLF